MKKKNNAIMIADTRTSLIGHLLLQIKDTNPDLFDEAIIYYEEISNKDKEIMNKIMPCKFIKFDYKFSKNVTSLDAFKKFSSLMFSRYYMFDLLDEYNTVTWIDTDVLIKGDLSDIIFKANKTGMSANFEDPVNKSYLNTDIVKTSFYNPVNGYDMSRYNMSSGILTVSDKLENYNVMSKWCFDKTIEYASNLKMPDQGVLNLLIQEFNINVTSLGENGAYCFYPSYKRDFTNAKVVHSWGVRKFWKSWYLYNTYPEWKEYYQKWLDLGGSDCFGEIKPDVSVVIPSYHTNVHYLDLVLSDLLVKQVQKDYYQYDNFEIILVIDGEISEKLTNLLKKYDDPRVVVIHNKERAGIAKSLNIGINASKGKYIARIDDDDRINVTRLYKQVKYLDEHKDIDLVSSYFEYFGDLNENRVTFSGELSHAWSIFTCPFDHPTVMFRKDFIINNNLFYDETRSHVEDWELWLRCFERGMKMGVIKEVLYYHRWYNGQAGQNIKTVEMMRELVKKNFEKLDVHLTDEELTYISPWQGKVSDEKILNLKRIFNLALQNNIKYGIYDQESLKKVFDYRIKEAETGILKEVVNDNFLSYNFDSKNLDDNIIRKENKIKRIVKKIIKPCYNIYKRITCNIIKESIANHIEKVNNVDESVSKLNNEISSLKEEMNYLLNNEINNLYFKKKIILIENFINIDLEKSASIMGIKEIIRNNFNDYYFININNNEFFEKIEYLQKIINSDDIILLVGSENLGDNSYYDDIVCSTTIKKFPNNKICIFTQPIDCLNITYERNFEVYRRHKYITIFSYCDKSLEYLKKNISDEKCCFCLNPAIYLNYSYNCDRNGILCYFEKEGCNQEDLIDIVKKNCDNYNIKYVGSVDKLCTKDLIQNVYGQLELFASYKVVITDNYSGLIFSLMTNTPCIVVDSLCADLFKEDIQVSYLKKDLKKIDEKILTYLKSDYLNYECKFNESFNNVINNIKNK